MLSGSRLSVTDIRGAIWFDMIARHKRRPKHDREASLKLKREVVVEAEGGVK